MQLLYRYLKNYKGPLALALILATINQIFSLLDPQIFRLLVDNYASRFATLTAKDYLTGVSLLLLATMGVAFVSRLSKSLQSYYTSVVTEKLGAKLYNDSITHSFMLAYEVFEDQRSGEFLEKLKTARRDSQRFIKQLINTLFITVVGVVLVIAYSFIVHWSIGLVYALLIPVLGLATFWITRSIQTAQKEIVAETQALSGATTETLRNVQLVKSLGLEQQEIQRLNTTNQKILGLELKKVKLVRAHDFVQGTLVNLLRMGLMLLMFWLIYTGTITLGEFFSLLFYSFFIFSPLSSIGEVAVAYQETKASLGKLEEILSIPKAPVPKHAKRLGEIQKIIFDDVSFGYASGNTEALQNINIEIAKGTTVAFVGPSGSGKSTTIKMIVGLYQPTAGKILFNDLSSEDIDIAELRKRIGLVAQETQLFSGSIRENLLFVKPDATDKECMEMIKAASVEDILHRGGKGLDTKIGEGGLKLSGGEKQRLAIARALLRHPEILIFDEATSSLDSITEEAITQTIKEIEEQRPDLIRILVAHRLPTVMHANTIFVLEKGKLVESGTHEELLKTHGLYAAMWRQQMSE